MDTSERREFVRLLNDSLEQQNQEVSRARQRAGA